MAIKTSELNAKLFGKADKRRATTPAEAQSAVKAQAQMIELAVAGEEVVTFELMRIPADEVAEKPWCLLKMPVNRRFNRTCLG